MENKVKVVIKAIVCTVIGTVLGLGIVKFIRTVFGNDDV